MVELQSLKLQLENMKILYEDAMMKGYSMETIKLYFNQIKEIEELIEKRKKKLGV